jgi:glycosyltransferase involved in cell wall biosynthesis
LQQKVAPDALVVTSMVDLATIRGLHPALADVPALVYFHENQFAYPRSDRQTTSIDAQMVQLYGALAADRVAFNSEYNRRTFLDGIEALMAKMPDLVPSGLAKRIADRSTVLPVPVDPIHPSTSWNVNRDPERIVWNHRWEYDKNPERFVDAMIALVERGVDFRLALLGPRPRHAAAGAGSLARIHAGPDRC